MSGIAHDRGRCLHREARRKNRYMAEQALLRGGEKIVAPVECCTERLMAGERRPTPPRQQAETIVQMGSDLGYAEHGGARRRELDGERDAVQTLANAGD